MGIKKSPQIVNPLVRFRNKAQGRYSNRVSGGTHARAITQDETACFYVVSATMGVVRSDVIEICFNKDLDNNCVAGWDFKKNGTSFTSIAINGIAQPCIRFNCSDGTENDSAGPTDTITMDYTPGTCSADGEADCLLDALTDYPVQNRIYGPSTARVNPDRDNVVVILFPVAPSVIGTAWQVKVNAVARTINNSAIVGNNIELTIDVSVDQGDTVVFSQGFTGTRCTAIDGRECHWFYDAPVVNAVGSEYWIQEASQGFWLLEGSLGGWQIE